MKFLIFLFGVLAVASPSLAQVANSCVTDTTKCETIYDTSVPNDQGSQAIYCQLTNVLVSCIDAQAARTDCGNNAAEVQRLRKKAQESLNLHKCVGIVDANKCQADLDACSRSFTSAIAQVGDDRGGQCQAGAAYIKCLADRDSDPSCKDKTAAIDKLRKKTQEDIATAGCGSNPDNPKLECNDDVKTCETRFQTDVTSSGTNVQKACQAGATLDACLKGRELQPDCKGSQSIIDTMRKSYKEQIDQEGCGSAHAMKCAQGVQDCNTAYTKMIPTLTNPQTQCSGANAFVDCLNGLSCSASYHGQLEQSVTMVTNRLKGSSCKLKALHGSSTQIKPAATVLLLMALAILVA